MSSSHGAAAAPEPAARGRASGPAARSASSTASGRGATSRSQSPRVKNSTVCARHSGSARRTNPAARRSARAAAAGGSWAGSARDGRDMAQLGDVIFVRGAGSVMAMAAERGDGAGPPAARGSGRKRRWRPVLLRSVVGSIQEGRGFAFRRKQKIERQYRKLLKKRKQVHSQQDDQFTDTYPEHLKHLYLAEEERLKKRRRTPDDSVSSEEKLNKAAESVVTHEKFKNKTSSQKAKEEYEKIKAERARKKEEAEKRKQQREEAQRLYKKKKMEAYKILSKKTKKGQPNLNLQVEFLLQKIQQNT